MTSCFAALKDLLFPPVCLGCARRLDTSRPPLFCADCLAELVFLRSPWCECCGMPFVSGADHLCSDCLAGHFAFDRARSLLMYQPPMTGLILSLKFGGRLTALGSLAPLVAGSECGRSFAPPDLVLPVPLHPSRLRKRGFNQSLLLARACFPHWQQRLASDVLVRSRATTAQSLLSGKNRRTNLHNAFALTNPSAVAGRRVLLVDDVFTTGSTVNECSKVLQKSGAQGIEVFTLARSLSR